MRPDERHRRAGSSSKEQLTLRDVRRVPDLLGNHPALVGEGFQGTREAARLVAVSRRELVVGALTDEQGPRSTHAGAVERCAVFVLAVPIAVVAAPRGTVGRLDLQESIDDAQRVEDPRVTGLAKTKTNESERIRADDVDGRLASLPEGT